MEEENLLKKGLMSSVLLNYSGPLELGVHYCLVVILPPQIANIYLQILQTPSKMLITDCLLVQTYNNMH